MSADDDSVLCPAILSVTRTRSGLDQRGHVTARSNCRHQHINRSRLASPNQVGQLHSRGGADMRHGNDPELLLRRFAGTINAALADRPADMAVYSGHWWTAPSGRDYPFATLADNCL